MSKTFTRLMFTGLGIFLIAVAFIVTIRSLTDSSLNDTKDGDIIGLHTQAGGASVQAKNPINATNFISIGAGVYVSDERQLGPEVGYSMTYFEEDSSFAIDISGKPTAAYRKKASDYLLKTLQITEVEACQLRVYIGVSYATDPNQTGKNLGLSFCPDSVQL
jgi:hypothetical protein